MYCHYPFQIQFGNLKKGKKKKEQEKILRNRYKREKPAFTKNTGSSGYKQKMLEAGHGTLIWPLLLHFRAPLVLVVPSTKCPGPYKMEPTPAWLSHKHSLLLCWSPDSSNHVSSFLEKECPFGFLKTVATLGQNWLSRYTCSQDFQREKCSMLVYVIQPDRTHGSLGLKGAGELLFPISCNSGNSRYMLE